VMEDGEPEPVKVPDQERVVQPELDREVVYQSGCRARPEQRRDGSTGQDVEEGEDEERHREDDRDRLKDPDCDEPKKRRLPDSCEHFGPQPPSGDPTHAHRVPLRSLTRRMLRFDQRGPLHDNSKLSEAIDPIRPVRRARHSAIEDTEASSVSSRPVRRCCATTERSAGSEHPSTSPQ